MEWFPGSPLDCITPLGPAQAIGYVWDTEQTEWCCRINRTGEVFNFTNKFFRLASTVTNGHPDVSPFEELNDKTRRQVERYRRNGWLVS